MYIFKLVLVFSFRLIAPFLGTNIPSSNAQKPFKTAKIIKGVDCDPAVHKFVVLIQSSLPMRCAGTIINEYWVLTAAHCCRGLYNLRVVAGLSKDPDSVTIEIGVSTVYMHPLFSSHAAHDIALMKLERPLHESKHVKYVRLPNETGSEFCVQGLVMGWGRIVWPQRSIVVARDIKCVVLPVISTRRCRVLFEYFHESEVCTLSFEGKDACQGDSGGPLMCGDVQIGIVGYGIGCGVLFSPGIYTRIDYHLNYINDVMLNSTAVPVTSFFNVILLSLIVMVSLY